MACRRRDRRNLTSCNIGDVANRGCSRGCCPYPDSAIFENSHDILPTTPYFAPLKPYFHDDINNPDIDADFASRGRTNLRFRACGSLSHRPKFICLNPECTHRRVFKPFVDEDKFEFRIDRTGWSVRPSANETPLLQDALRRGGLWAWSSAERAKHEELIRRLDESEREQGGAWGRGIEFWHRIAAHDEKMRVRSEDGESQANRLFPQRRRPSSSESSPASSVSDLILTPMSSIILTPTSSVDNLETVPIARPLTIAELTDVMSREPQLWWQDIHKYGGRLLKRCPGCGTAGTLIGSNFRVPTKKDDRAWAELLTMAATGIDLNAHFVYCPTIDEYNEMRLEANRIRGQKINHEAWQEEKERRIEKYRLLSLSP